MIKYDIKIDILFKYWLIISLLLVFLIIIVGGLTRLTDSGLSITQWELFKGILPPLNDAAWIQYFDRYKEIPQYKILNFNMSLKEFKIIFYWEYFHRILGRVIGLFFIIPLIFFYLSQKIKIKYLNYCSIIFLLILIQGTIGWYMVKSGLVNDITVSHYRLSLHLSTAVAIIGMIFWLLLNFNKKTFKVFFNFSKRNIPFLLLLFLIYLQIIIGAFVSGLDAGLIYQTWPLMNTSYFPNDLIFKNLSTYTDFNNHSLVQFYHRNLAYIILLYFLILSSYIFRKKIKKLYNPIFLVSFFLILQVILGIYTLISGLNIYTASAHQITSILLIFSSINLYFCNIK